MLSSSKGISGEKEVSEREKQKGKRDKDIVSIVFQLWRIKQLTHIYYWSLMEKKTKTKNQKNPVTISNFSLYK